MATVKERQALREVADNLKSEANELEGLVTWFSIHLEDGNSSTQLQILRQEVMKKRREREIVVWFLQNSNKILLNNYIPGKPDRCPHPEAQLRVPNFRRSFCKSSRQSTLKFQRPAPSIVWRHICWQSCP